MKEQTTLPDMNAPRKYSYKPNTIGAVIQDYVEKKRITRDQMAARLKINKRSVYRVYNLKHPKILHLMQLSEAIDENLLLHYHPNVAPKPHPLEAENAQLKTENEQLKSRINREQQLEEENKLLKAQLEILREVVKGR